MVVALAGAGLSGRPTPPAATAADAATVAAPPDVPDDASYRDAALWALSTGALRTFADGTFRPGSPVTRAQLASVMWRLAGRPDGVPVAELSDVGASGRRAIDWAVDRRILGADRDHRFRPDRAADRAALGVALWRWAGALDDAPSRTFADLPAGSRHQAAFEWLIANGVLTATPTGAVRPAASVTRARVAVALKRVVDRRDAGPPNLVAILTDDQTLESMRVMPQARRLLAGEGTTFANAFATFPLCCPSRATLLTGQYSHNTHVENNVLPLGGYATLDHTNTLATWLHARGYATAHVGKYLNCYGSTNARCGTAGPDVPPGWDDWFGLPDPYPTNYSYMSFDAFDNGTLRHFGPAADVYQTGVLAQRAVQDIGRFAERPQPFFVNIWPQAPHSGLGPTAPNTWSPAPAPAYAGTMADQVLPNAASYGEADLSDKPAYVRGWYAAHWPAENREAITRSYRAALESLRSVDDLVGDVVESLRRSGQLDRTVIVFTSDNGWTFGEHQITWWKVVPYEESIHVPLIIRGPGFPAGATATQVVGNIDLAPTLVDLSGATPGRTMDGRSLVPLAQDPSLATDRAVLLEDWPEGTSPVVPHYTGVRAQGEVYVEYDNGDRELYDLTADPHQLDNRAGDPAHAARRAVLASALARLRGCAGAACEVTVAPG